MNRHTIIGRLGADPKELSGDGAKFSVATEHRWKKNNEPQEETDWHDVLCFGSMAQFAIKHVRKGDTVLVEGRSKRRSYEHEGATKYAVEIVATTLRKLN